jgi:hypothetical protein
MTCKRICMAGLISMAGLSPSLIDLAVFAGKASSAVDVASLGVLAESSGDITDSVSSPRP